MHYFGETNHLRELPALQVFSFQSLSPLGRGTRHSGHLAYRFHLTGPDHLFLCLLEGFPKRPYPWRNLEEPLRSHSYHGVIWVYFFSFCRSFLCSFTYQTFLYLLAGINISSDTGNCSRHQKPWRGYSSFPVRRMRMKKVLTQALEVLKKDSRIKLLFENRERDFPYSLQIKEEIHTIMMDHLET